MAVIGTISHHCPFSTLLITYPALDSVSGPDWSVMAVIELLVIDIRHAWEPGAGAERRPEQGVRGAGAGYG